MPSRFIGALALGSLVALAAGIAVAEDRAADLLAKKLAEFPRSQRGQVIAITSQPLVAVFPNDQFYVLRFRQYPVAIAPPEPLQANNVFVVKPDGSVMFRMFRIGRDCWQAPGGMARNQESPGR